MRIPTEKLPRPLRQAYSWIAALITEYNKDNGGFVAAAVAFYTFVSIIPLILVGVAVFGFILGSREQSHQILLSNAREVLPGEVVGDIEKVIRGIITGSTPAGIIGFLLLLWFGSAVFVNLGRAMNIAWNSKLTRGYVKDRLVAMGTFFAAGILVLASILLTTAANLLRQQEILGYELSQIPFIWQFLAFLIPPILTIAMFTLVYRILPTADVPLKAAFVGGITAGSMWEILKIGFAYYLTHFANFGAVYGSLATVIIMILWIFYSSIIAVLGAEASQVYTERVLGRISRLN